MTVWKPASSISEESTWFRRCYNCNFCEREFKSAQALGGHMNVHRRDRALLRLSLDSNSSSTFLPPNNAPLITRMPDYLPQKPNPALPTSPDNRSTTLSPFFDFFDTSSSNLGSHGRNPYSKQTGLHRIRYDAVYSNPFELNIEHPSPPLSFVGSQDVANLEIKMDWRTVSGNNIPNNIDGLDLELRLGYTY